MKLSKLLKTLLLIVPLVFSSCFKDDDGRSLGEYIIELGNIKGEPSAFKVVTDRGDTLFPSANNHPDFEIEDNKRVWVNYTILGESSSSGIDYLVRINKFTSILTKDTVLLTPENVDSLGSDEIRIDDYWIANDYLNIAFTYEGSPYYIHYINMAMDVENPTLEDGTPLFEMRHNKNGDPYTTPPINGYISIDLRPFKEGEIGTYKFQLKALGFSGEYDFDELINYSWGNDLSND